MPSSPRLLAAAAALALPLVLSGCTVTPFVQFIHVQSAQQPTTAAGEYYLDTICPRNAAIDGFNEVHASRDLEQLHQAAAAAATASATAADGLRAADAPWPDGLKPQIELLARSLDDDERSYDQVAAATTLQEAWDVAWPGNTSAGDARFVIRKAVGLGDGQTVDDCVGHYGPAAGEATS